MGWETAIGPGYVVSDDPARLDRDLVHRFLSEESYWARGRPHATTERAMDHSLCIGLYGPDGQAGFARVVTDRAVFAWLSDVFVLPAHRGRGLARAMVAALLDHPELRGVRRWMLTTRDAHGVYAGLGFVGLAEPGRFMMLERSGEPT